MAAAAADGCFGPAEVPIGLERASDATIPEKAVGKAGEGRLCRAEAYRTKVPIPVTRVWDAANPDSRLGRWWGPTKARGPVAEYRRTYAICAEWSALDRTVACTVKPGALVIVGTSQSAKCNDGTVYPASAVVHLFVPDPAASLVDCSPGEAFP